MTTALDTIKTAMRLIGVLEAGEAPASDESVDALGTLNAMLAGFPADGIKYAHQNIDVVSDPVPMPEEQILHVKHLLAVYLAAEYGATPSPIVMAAAENGRRYLQGVYQRAETAPVDRYLTKPLLGSYDWTNDR